jgi:hypothetical protein
VVFNPDFDFFESRAKWISLAAFRAVRGQAQVTSQQRTGSQKYRVYGPEGGGFAEWASSTTVKRLKGVPTVGEFEIMPNPVYTENGIELKVRLDDVRTRRNIYFLTSSTCTGTLPWIAGKGPGPGWSVLGEVTEKPTGYVTEIAPVPRMKSMSTDDLTDWIKSKGLPYTYANSGKVVTGATDGGVLGLKLTPTIYDAGRCLVAVAPAVGTKNLWVSQPLKLDVLPFETASFSLAKSSFEVSYGDTVEIGGRINGGQRSLSFFHSGKRLGSIVSNDDGTFRHSLTMSGDGFSRGVHEISLLADATRTHEEGQSSVSIKINRALITGSVSISSSLINAGQQFTLSGTLNPAISGKYVWARTYCSGHSNYPSGWATQTSVWSVNAFTGAPTGNNNGLENYNWQPGSHDYAIARTDSSGSFTMTFTSSIPRTCVFGAYIPQSDVYSAWVSEPTSVLVVQ